ncbi:hypothetical protein PMSM_00065 [Paenibacillus macquariensis subsp. macquariensis]|uniref:CubicO group peptidase, beta-lactamase class C family n=2 Tax=Paenibacillus macquariensis TaxID=948756 RepID=A0ABY1K2M9_9BACL|nr:serine hydrolase domain-containing protein [Paenibacillus macquariensis]OAB39566.1 hypothetical protein PMSM_00065 [Paenibacillus macquariensis subsp. macquariensis]SIR17088.1 CubicO group peptidase, beta-lactamase class C family [Paenibacillus macquariensis]
MEKKEVFSMDVEQLLTRYRVPGISVAVFRNGKLELTRGHGLLEYGMRGSVNVNTIFHACSISKMITAIGVLRLVDKGVLRLDENVASYLKSWELSESEYTNGKQITLASLLAHQGGFMDHEESFDAFTFDTSYPTLDDLLLGSTNYNPTPVQVSYLPENQFIYSDYGYCIVEKVIEDCCGRSFSSVMKELVFEPLNLTRTFFRNYQDETDSMRTLMKMSAAGHNEYREVVLGKHPFYPNLAGAGLWTSPREMAHIAISIIEAWNGGTSAILSLDMARMMLSGFGCDKSIGLGVFVPQANEGECFVSKGWGVGYQCMLVAFPRIQAGIVVMTNSDPGVSQEESLVGEVIHKCCNQFGWNYVC